jgi:phosphoribosylanthranilate isomerase
MVNNTTMHIHSATPLVKVCGMRNPDNISELAQLAPNLMGFIFYPKSKRFVHPDSDPSLTNLPESTQAVGVFVDQPMGEVLNIAKRFNLKYLQLHGSESPAYCQEFKNMGYGIIKVFAINHPQDLAKTQAYHSVADYLLFDTPSAQHGGTGQVFSWDLLQNYSGPTPFLIAGGIGPNNIQEAYNFQNPFFAGVDLNSKFELEPAQKDIKSLQDAFTSINFKN